MSLRHVPRQSHPQDHPPHMNGSSIIPNTPNGSAHPPNMVSPATISNPIPNGAPPSSNAIISKLNSSNEQTWLLIGRVAEHMGDLEHAMTAYENALRHNPMSLSGLTQLAGIARIKENYSKAVDYFQRVLQLQQDNGEIWSAIGHCYLMQDDLQKAYSAYQQALYLLPNPKEDPKLWYGIGILYDRYGSLDHAEDAFSSVLRMEKDFDKANEILFRLGIIYKQQGKYDDSLRCFKLILCNPPSPLAHADIWFQIGHVYEQQKDLLRAKDAYERVVAENPSHAKVLQQLGWLYHQDGSSFQNQELAIQHLTKSLEADPSDAQSWYLLGRAYMAGAKYNKAYEAYQQAVYRDGRNPTFWCSIGVLYFQINQFRDALDAYSRAIRINPYISEVWFDLGSLYESCNNQISDAIDAYARAAELDPSNSQITQRLELLRNAQVTGIQIPAAPGPQDVHPTLYSNASVPPHGLTGPPLMLQSSGHRPLFRTESRGPPTEISLPPPSQVNPRPSSGPFRSGPPPPLILDETRHHSSSHPPLAPMDVDRPPAHGRDHSNQRDGPSRGPVGHQSLLLQHPAPQQHSPFDELRNGHHPDPYYRGPRAPSRSVSPQSHVRRPSPGPFPPYQNSRPALGPAQPSAVPSQRSPRMYPPSHEGPRPVDPDGPWERRPPTSNDPREWDREREGRRPRYAGDYPPHPPQQQPMYPRSPPADHHRAHSPPEPNSRNAHPPRYWDSKPTNGSTAHPGMSNHNIHHRGPSPPPSHHEHTTRRYDPRFDAREQYDNDQRAYPGSPEGLRNVHRNPPPPQHVVGSNIRESESPHPPNLDRRRRLSGKDKDPEPQPQPPQMPLPPPSSVLSVDPKSGRRRRTMPGRRKEDELDTPKFGPVQPLPPPKVGYPKGPSSPEMSNSSSSRSVQPSPTNSTPAHPARVVYDDYDEGVTDALMSLRSFRSADGPQSDKPSHSPVFAGSRHGPSPQPQPHAHRSSVSSTRSHASPPSQSAPLKRALSPGPEEMAEAKRSRMDSVRRRVSSPGRRTPVQSTRPSPIPFRTQPASHSPEARQTHDGAYSPTPSLPVPNLPPHPRPTGMLNHANGSSLGLPPIATLPPTPTAPSPNGPGDRDDRMQVDVSRSTSPPGPRSKLSEVVHRNSRSPPKQPSTSPRSDKKEAGP